MRAMYCCAVSAMAQILLFSSRSDVWGVPQIICDQAIGGAIQQFRFSAGPAIRQLREVTEMKGGHVMSVDVMRSEEHTSELQSLAYLVCRLLLEKKKKSKLTVPVSTSP